VFCDFIDRKVISKDPRTEAIFWSGGLKGNLENDLKLCFSEWPNLIITKQRLPTLVGTFVAIYFGEEEGEEPTYEVGFYLCIVLRVEEYGGKAALTHKDQQKQSGTKSKKANKNRAGFAHCMSLRDAYDFVIDIDDSIEAKEIRVLPCTLTFDKSPSKSVDDDTKENSVDEE
jgi:hypothetical protein